MRTIKFRAWDKDVNKWFYFGDDADTFQIPYHLACYENWGQFTGLLDKNGKEIYEGDIVKTEYGASGIVEYIVEEVRFGFDCNEPMWKHPIHDMNGEKEVIGNVYEHKDLPTL